MFCIECGQQLSEDSQFCGSCGATVTDATSDVFCIECGAKQPADAEFCIECGTKVVTDSHEKDEQLVVPEPEPPIIEEPITAVMAEPETVEPPRGSSGGMVKVLAVTTILLLAAVIGLVVFMFLGQDDENSGETGYQHETHDPYIPAGVYMPADEYHIQRVRNGHLQNHPDVAIGFAFERFFDQIVWTYSYVPEEALSRVFVHGYMPPGDADPDGAREMGQFVFQFAADGSFSPIRFVVGGYFQDVFVMYETLDTIINMSR